MTLLSVVQDAAVRLGLSSPSTVVSNTDETATRLFSLANQAGKAIAKRHDWTVLTKEQTFTTVAASAQTDAIPSDFDRFVPDTAWNRTARRPLQGPIPAQVWAQQSAQASSILLDAYRQRGGDFLMIPTPTAGQTVAFEYVSKWWVDTDADGIADADAYAADTDVAVLDEEMVTIAVKWMYRHSLGLNYAEEFRSAEAVILDRIARDGGRQTVDYGSQSPRWPRPPTPQEGSWNLS